MKSRLAAMAAISALVLLEGCVTQPDGPTVPVMPGKGKSMAQFQNDDMNCQGYAESRVAGQAHAANNRAVTDAILGTALGAGLGAAVGGGHGAAVGAASGAVVGTAVGANQSAYSQGSLQGRYNIIYAQCMQAAGNQVPYGPPPGYGYGPRRDYDGDYPPPPPPPPGY